MPQQKKRIWYVSPSSGLTNEMIATEYPNASEQRELRLGPACKTKKLDCAYELTPDQITRICKTCIESNICSLREFTRCVFVRIGENEIRPAHKNEWNPNLVRIKKTQKRTIRRFVKGKIGAKRFLPHHI